MLKIDEKIVEFKENYRKEFINIKMYVIPWKINSTIL